MITLTTADFTYNKTNRSLCADASELQGYGWQDNITVKSIHTGREITFGFVNTLKDADNDIAGWVYMPLPGIASPIDYLTIFND